MITLGLHTPDPRDATSFYRAYGPWTSLKDRINIRPIEQRDQNWFELAGIDVLFCHRPFSQTHVNMILQAKAQNVPVWIDFDDDLFAVHHSNDNHSLYADPRTQQTLCRVLAEANLVTVSTENLKKRYSQYAKRVEVVANKLPEHMLGPMVSFEPATLPRKAILWRGTKHHEVNLDYYRECFVELMHKNPDWVFVFYGYRPWYIMEGGFPGQSKHAANGQILGYLKELQDMHCAIQVVPLIDHPFNHAKSSIAYLEGSGIGGSVCVVPDLPEWNTKQGIILYKCGDKEAFTKSVQRTIDMSDRQRRTLAELAKRHIVYNETTKSTENIRLEMLASLLSTVDKL
jgi:hypothetical protein